MAPQTPIGFVENTDKPPEKSVAPPKYVIITPAYNEEKFIGKTIDSVLAQTHLPHKWIIVDDGSTDATIQVIRQRTQGCAFVQCYSRDRDPSAEYYKSNVHAIQYGYSKVADSDFDYLAVLDADIVLEKDY
jgi:biofilm PGA synthesis N-glycosyltransferase PgaC